MTTYILCAQCGQAMPMRGTKQYCSPACRAQHFRDYAVPLAEAEADDDDEEPDEASAPAETLLPRSRPVALSPGPPPAPTVKGAATPHSLRELIVDAVRQSSAEHNALAAQQLVAQHADYTRWVQAWLQQEGQPLAARVMRQLLKKLSS